MGQSACGACSDSCPNGTDVTSKGKNRSGEYSEGHPPNPTYAELSSDEDDNESIGSSEPEEYSVAPNELTDEDIEAAYQSWKAAIEQGNETLAGQTANNNDNLCPHSMDSRIYVQSPQSIPISKQTNSRFRWDNGDNALHTAVQKKHSRLVFFLLTQGIGVNEQNIHSLDSALHYAVRNVDHKVVELLLNWDADPNIMNRSKESPMSMAQELNDQQVILDVLLEARAKDGRADEQDNTLNVEEPEFHKKTTSMRMERWTAKRQMREESESTDSAESESSVQGSGYEDETDGSKYTDLSKVGGTPSITELEKVSIRSKNPFSKLGRQNTKTAKQIVKESLKNQPLPKLESWLEKKKPGGVVPTYQKRWVVVKGAHFLWSKKQRAIANDANREERKKFNGAIHLTTIDKIAPIQTSANNKFMVRAKDAKNDNEMREYVFRCTNKSERDFWCSGLKEHQRQYRKVMSYLGR